MDRKIEKKKWTPKKIILTAGIICFAGIILYSFVFGDQSRKLNVDKDKITISTVERGPFQEYILVTGTVQPIKTFFLDVAEGGRVVQKFVEDGSFVKAGDPIVKLENANTTLNIMYNEAQLFQQINSLRSTRLSMEQNKLNLQQQLLDVQYQLMDKKRIYDMNKKLYEKKLISEMDFKKSEDDYLLLKKRRDLTLETQQQDSIFRVRQINQLETSIKQMQNNLDLTKKQLENLTVKAPINGQLSGLTAEIGESISQGQNLGQIDVIDSFKVRAGIDEHYIARVGVGQKGEFNFNGKDYQIEIKNVYPQVTNGMFQVDLHFTGKQPEGIRRGQTLHIKLELGELSTAVIVPRGGFYNTTGGQWIFVLDKNGSSAEKRNIQLGRQNTQYFEVLEGLKPSEKVITSSYDNYSDIDKLILN